MKAQYSKDGRAVRLTDPTVEEFRNSLSGKLHNRILVPFSDGQAIAAVREQGKLKFVISTIEKELGRVLKYIAIAEDRVVYLKSEPAINLLAWMCAMHNVVASQASKPAFAEFTHVEKAISYQTAVGLTGWDYLDEEQWADAPDE